MKKAFKIWCETKEERDKVLEKMEREGYKWLGGEKPTVFLQDRQTSTALFVKDKIIQYSDNPYEFVEDKREAYTVSDFLCMADHNKIIIYQEGRLVVALNKATGEKAIAKCNPADEFVFDTGAKLAFNRLMGIEDEKPEPDKPEYFTGKAVYLGHPKGRGYDCGMTIGKVYEFINGKYYDDDGDYRPTRIVDPIEEKYLKNYCFLKVVE